MSTVYKDYKNDPKVLYVKCNVELAADDTVKVGYFTPTATSIAYWNGQRNDHEGDGYYWIKVTLPYGTTSIDGHWRLQSYVEFSGVEAGKGIHGSVERWEIFNLGS